MMHHLQIALASLIAILYALAFYLGLRHMRTVAAAGGGAAPAAEPKPPSMGIKARLLVAVATVAIAILLGWRAFAEKDAALPFGSYLDAFLLLSLLLAICMINLRAAAHLATLSFYILPMLTFLLLLGIGLGLARPEPFGETAWRILHLGTLIAGSTCFALACVSGVLYLLAARQLKTKRMGKIGVSRFPPLASLEKLTRWMVYTGFPLLTVGIITGILWKAHGGAQQPLSKIAVAIGAWAIYAILLPLAPSFRGRRAAWLSIVGFVLVLGGYVTATMIR